MPNNSVTKQYVVAFAKPFSDIHIKRLNEDYEEIKDIKVPLVYATKSKLSYLLQREASADSASLVLPVIGFSIIGMQYNGQRKLCSLNTIDVGNDQYVYEGVPYDYNFSLSIKSKFQDDLYQILEQILYKFKPDISLEVKEVPELGITRDVTISLDSIAFDLNSEMDNETNRTLSIDLDFTLQGMVYPSPRDSKIIYDIFVNFRNNFNKIPEADDIYATVHTSFQDPDILTIINEN